jgi:hypothetical protein
VDRDHPLPGPCFEKGETVLAEISRHVGLIDGDRRYAQLIGRPHGSSPEFERRGEVDDVGGEVREDAANLRDATDGEAHIGISGDRNGWQPHDPHAVSAIDVVRVDCRRGYHQHLVAPTDEMLENTLQRVRDSVDEGKVGLSDDRDPHASTVSSACGQRSACGCLSAKGQVNSWVQSAPIGRGQ